MVIYKITNKVNGKIYIGQTSRSVHKRWLEHIRYKGNSCILSKAIKKYEKENFLVQELFNAFNQTYLNEIEQHFIKYFNCLNPRGYNLTTGGEYGKHSEISKEKIRKTKIGSKNPRYNKPGTLLGKKGKNHPWYKRKHSKESKLKMSFSAKKTKIRCKELNKIFNSIKEAAIELNLQSSNIHKVLTKKRLHTKFFTFEYLKK